MIIERISSMLESCSTDQAHFPPSELLYNEGWLLRVIIDWFSTHPVPGHPLSFPDDGKWYSEALLPSAFLPRERKDPLGESRTHADLVIGHFKIGNGGKANLSILPEGTHFVVVEAKLFSKLSTGVTHASYYNQAARTVACIAEVLEEGSRKPGDMSNLGFYLLAPDFRIKEGVFDKPMTQDDIRKTVKKRSSEYGGLHDKWLSDWFSPTLDKIDIRTISWEKIIGTIKENDPDSGQAIDDFYKQCLKYNEQVKSESYR